MTKAVERTYAYILINDGLIALCFSRANNRMKTEEGREKRNFLPFLRMASALRDLLLVAGGFGLLMRVRRGMCTQGD